MENFSPAVSVIVPVFNAEKYLGVCLESILIQTFTDFEVIVVDDCSTDASLTVAENFLERFNGRLKIISLEENTGSPAIPRNVGLNFARGKYVYFMDADDLLIDNAFETLYNFAEKYQADVVSMKSGFACGENSIDESFRYVPWAPKEDLLSTEPVLELKNFFERLEKYSKSQFEWVPWSKFLRRELLLERNIKFPEILIDEDLPWSLNLVFSASRWLRVTPPLYVQRHVSASFSRRIRPPQQSMRILTNALVLGVEYIDKFMSEQKFFTENPDACLRVLHFFADTVLEKMNETFRNLSTQELGEIFRQEISKTKTPNVALIFYLFVVNNLYRNERMNHTA